MAVPIEPVVPVIDRGYFGDRGEFSTATPAAPWTAVTIATRKSPVADDMVPADGAHRSFSRYRTERSPSPV